jgi:hypothetical protein
MAILNNFRISTHSGPISWFQFTPDNVPPFFLGASIYPAAIQRGGSATRLTHAPKVTIQKANVWQPFDPRK